MLRRCYMSKKSIYSATYGKLDELFGMNRSDSAGQRRMDAAQDQYDSQEEPGDYVDSFSEDDMEIMSDAQDIASMAAQQHSGGNIDQLAYELGHNASYDSNNQKTSEGEILINDIKQALVNREISYTDLFRKYQNGESIVADIDFMDNLG